MTTLPEGTSAELATPLADLHRAAGASLATYFGVQLPDKFGDFAAEARIARQNVALIDTNFRAVLSLGGPDRKRYLNAVLTSNIRDLAPGQGTIGLLLNSQGHILAELQTLALEDRLLILSHLLVRKRTFDTLDKFIIMDDATLADETEDTGTLAIEGPEAANVVRELTGLDLLALAPRAHAEFAISATDGEIRGRLLRGSHYGFPGAEFIVPRVRLAALWSVLEASVRKHGGAPLGYDALNALRLEAGIPWFGADFDDRQIPHEAGLEATHISFTKGCYTGQEIVERVRSRGQVNKRLTGIAFSGAEPPQPGASLTAATAAAPADAGVLTSAAMSPLLGKPIGMGYVRREYNSAGQALQCGAVAGEVLALPLAGAVAPSTS